MKELIAAAPGLVRTIDPEGLTALHWVVRPRCPTVGTLLASTRRLLEAAADVFAVDPTQEDTLHMDHADESPVQPEQVALILDHGADANA